MATASPTLRQRLGGAALRSWTLYWVIMVFVAIGTISVDPQSLAYGRNIGRWALVFGLSLALMSAVFLLVRATLFRRAATRPVPVWLVVAFGALLGFIRQGIVVWVAPSLGLTITERPVARLIGGMVIGAITIVAVVILIDEFDRRRDAVRALQARLMDVRAVEADRDDLVASMTDRVYAEVVEAAAGARADLDAPYDAMGPEERLQAAARLRQAVVDDLRPLSHRLDAAREVPAPDISMRHAVRAALRRQPLQPLAAGVFVAVVVIPYATSEGPWWWPVASGALHGLLVFLGLVAAQALARLGGFFQRHTLVIGITLAVALTEARLIVSTAITGDTFGMRYLGSAVWLIIAVLMTSLLGAAFRGERILVNELGRAVDQRAVDAAVADRELVRVSRDIAQYVHGTLQGTLLATAFAIEDATRRGDDAALATALDQAREALDTAPAPGATAGTLVAEVEDRAAMWRGFTDVVVQVDPALGAVPPTVITDVGRVVEEAIGNAHKHGHAARVEVLVAPSGAQHVRVCVSDDGPGPVGGVNGMGFTWLEFAAPGQWRLERGGPYGGSVLTVDLPRGA